MSGQVSTVVAASAVVLVVFITAFVPARTLVAAAAHECTPCELRSCPAVKHPHPHPHPHSHRAAAAWWACESGRTSARDPCGCCDGLCTRLEWEPCGGQDWALGYCALGLTCASFNSTGAARLPEIGVCKGMCDCVCFCL